MLIELLTRLDNYRPKFETYGVYPSKLRKICDQKKMFKFLLFLHISRGADVSEEYAKYECEKFYGWVFIP